MVIRWNAKMWIALLNVALVIAVVFAVWFFVIYRPDPYALPSADWRQFRSMFVSPEGRVVDTGNQNVSHSESQGYGLLFAEAFGDRETFDRIWNWTRQNLQTRPNDKLLSWQWKVAEDGTGAVGDPNNASDGDLLVSWALLRAFERWKDYTYQQAAAQILADLRRLDVVDSPDGLVMLPATDGFTREQGRILNPSYYIFPAFLHAELVFPGNGWAELAESGRRMLVRARFGQFDLVPDWLAVTTKALNDQTDYYPAPDFPPVFGYNAIRVPLNIAWEDPKSELIQPFGKFWRSFPDPARIPSTVNLYTNLFGEDPPMPGLQTLAMFVVGCQDGRPPTVADLPRIKPGEAYYSASLKLLTKLAISDCFRAGKL